MIRYNEEQLMMRDMFRKFLAKELDPIRDDIEINGVPPYEFIRKLYAHLGLGEMAAAKFHKQIEQEKAVELGKADVKKLRDDNFNQSRATATAAQGLLITELAKYGLGIITSLGVSTGLTYSAIMNKGTIAQKEKWALPLATFEKVGAWAITEPGSGSDAFGAMAATASRSADGGYLLNGNKTFITNGPYADTIVFICKLKEDSVEPAQRKILSFIIDKGMPGLTQSKPFKKMGIMSSPTGELFLDNVEVGPERLIGETEEVEVRSGAKKTFTQERTGMAYSSLGIVEECLERCVRYAKERVQFGQPIGSHQLIQEKIARMEVARVNLQNMVFQLIEYAGYGHEISLAEASAIKLYSARVATEVAMEAVQLHGGNGYMTEFRVEQLARDAKIQQIYAGTDEIQISAIARELLA
jgi:alkylation response protein AidB-like acyl-CoA dehydrogenase